MPDPEVTIRRATGADRSALVAFHLALYVDHQDAVVPEPARPLLAYRDWPAVLRADVDALMASPNAVVLVAESAGRIIGYATGSIDDGDPRRLHVRKGTVGDWWVEPEHRSRGVGARLLDALLSAFRDAACTIAESQTWPGNRHARHVHEDAGFHEVKVVYRRLL